MADTVTEIAFFYAKPGTESAFAEAIRAAADAYIAVSEGCQSLAVRQGIETPTTFVVTVEWESLDAHQAFRDSDRLAKWRGAITDMFERPPFVEHYTLI